MDKKVLLLGVFVCLAFLVFMIVANAAITMVVPTTGTNWSVNISVNVTYLADTDFVWNDSTNMTVYYTTNNGTTWNVLSPANITCPNNTIGAAGTLASCNGTFTLSASTASDIRAKNGHWKNFTLNVSIYNDSTCKGAENATNLCGLKGPLLNKMLNITIDNTPPAVSFLSYLVGNLSSTANKAYAGNITMNISVNDTLLGIDTVYFNITNRTATVTNKQQLFVLSTRKTGDYYYFLLGGGANLSDGKYNITVYANDTYTNTSTNAAGVLGGAAVNSSTNNTETIQIIVDNSIPKVEPANFTGNQTSSISGIQDRGNYSGLILLNISLNDTQAAAQEAGIESVYFNITNSSGAAVEGNQTAFLKASKVTGSFWNYTGLNTSINTTLFPDGKYNVSIFVNDSAGNNNGTATSNAARAQIIIDNTGPTLSFSCDTTTPSVGETITCTCSGADSLSGVNTSSRSFTEHPATGDSGTFTTVCAESDYAGVHSESSITYTVESGYGLGGGGGGGASTGGKTQSWSKVTPGAATIMKNFDAAYGIKQIEITVSNEAQNVQITVNKYDSKPAEVTKEKTGKVYKYLQIKPQNLDTKLGQSIITIQVPKSWAQTNSVAKDNIALFKFENADWKELTTTYKEEDANNYYYTAQVTSFSYFAIGSKTAVGEEGAGGEGAEGGEAAGAGLLSSVWFWVILIVIVIAAVIAYLAYRKK